MQQDFVPEDEMRNLELELEEGTQAPAEEEEIVEEDEEEVDAEEDEGAE